MPKGKRWPEGRSPWAIAGESETTFNTALRLDVLRQDFNSRRMMALREAYEGVGWVVPPKYLPPGEAVEAAPAAPAVEPMVEHQAPPVEAVKVVEERPVEERVVEERVVERTAPSRAGPTARSATVGVSYRATVAQHDQLSAIAFRERTKIQTLLNEAVNDFLAKRRG